MRPGARQALLGSFRFDQSEEKRMDDVKVAFFASGNNPNAWRDGWHPDVAKVQVAAAEATPVEGWWNAGSSIPLLVIQGLQDTVAPPENGHMMKAEMGDRVVLIEIDGADIRVTETGRPFVRIAAAAFDAYLAAGQKRHSVAV